MSGSVVNAYDNSPCRICGEDVNVVTVRGSQTFGQARPDTVWRRICTNPECDSNRGGMAINQSI